MRFIMISKRQELIIYVVAFYQSVSMLGATASWGMTAVAYFLTVGIGYLVIDYINLLGE